MRHLTLLLTSLALVFSRAEAQVPGAVRQTESVEQRRQLQPDARSYQDGESAPELYKGENTDVGPQTVLRIKPRKNYFEAMADVQYFYTDNMFLVNHDKQSADVLVSTAQFALAPPAYELGGGKFAPRLGYRHEWYDFGLLSGKQFQGFDFQSQTFKQVRLHDFDFNAQTIFTDGRWMRGNWTVEAGLNYQRLLTTLDFDQFYWEAAPRWGARRLIPLDDTKALTIGYEGDYRFTGSGHPPPTFSDDLNDRTDHSLIVAYTQSLCPMATVQPYYRFQYTRFTKGESRNDYLHSFGLALYCPVTRQIGVRAFVGYDIMDTNSQLTPDYKKLDAGGGLNLTIRF